MPSSTMSNPSIRTTGPDLQPDESNDDTKSPATRKSLHQNIIGKLRPLPFQYRWVVWYEKQVESTNYDERLYLLHGDVADIATFYRVYNNYPWDKVKLRDSVHIFRKGTKPIWEDPENANGGCWTFQVPKAKCHAFFHELAILCMANELQAAVQGEHDHVLGVSSSVRFKTHLISVWNKAGRNEKSIRILGETIIERLSPELRPASSKTYYYKRHDEHDGYEAAMKAAMKNKEESNNATNKETSQCPSKDPGGGDEAGK
ncbi:hypothetical protein D8B26_007427 [Coccidioides posadasii str. Silveira]|uniref:Eukaryotic initiation factor 4E family protein n=1 Tax=Coccidioides posadasii (strain C735) TaxID=222929 RepID=C5PCQ1_COCP7|nr:Eukaryotic initiation factor 4E family protein [Coccidioides posadasii C735 delta SOWgp]EER24862.1 Eukaryotic initiation factor 4E family protein [Coccidioides posadasii C735 delta SOWgp]QVM12810.1 hypothetical protein D8B26_007427 [Coccidioides posadasii str. Silveira]|eukprot:XP_003067007.1 Eukaryotic initiation factor 4E family protein [Coccidioides posadasii C735 delta SOWgp]